MTAQSVTRVRPFKISYLIGRAYRGQPLLTVLGFVMLVAVVPTALAAGLDARTLNGVSVWLKPFKFQVSLAVHFLTVAWFMLFLPERTRGHVLVRALVAVIAVTGLFEIVYITLQAARGEASHFNLTTETTRFMYSLMGMAAISLLVATAGIGAFILRYGPMGNPVALACGLGLVIGSILGGLTGVYMGGQTGHWVGGPATDAGGVPILGWSRLGGDLRVAHFFGLHTIQLLPLATWGLSRFLTDGKVRLAVAAFAGCACAVTWAVFRQAQLGVPLLPI